MFVQPFGVQVYQIIICICWKQHAQGIHFFKYFSDVFFAVIMLAISMGNKIID